MIIVATICILTLHLHLGVVVIATWQVDLLSVISERRIHVGVAALLICCFHPCRNIPLMSDELEVLHAIVLTVEILCCVVEHMEVIHVLHGVYFLLQLAEVDIIVKAAYGIINIRRNLSHPFSFVTGCSFLA